MAEITRRWCQPECFHRLSGAIGQRSLTRRSSCQAASVNIRQLEQTFMNSAYLYWPHSVKGPEQPFKLHFVSVCFCVCWGLNSQRRVPGDSISSSMSSRSSESIRCCGGAVRIPRQAGSRLRAEAKNDRPGLFTMLNPVRDSICCQRCSFSLRAAVTSPRDCLSGGQWENDMEGYGACNSAKIIIIIIIE